MIQYEYDVIMIPHFIWNITWSHHGIYDVICAWCHIWCHMWMTSYMMSCAYNIICLVYDILYYIFTVSALLIFSPGPVQMSYWPVQIKPYLNQIQALLVSYVCLSVLATKSGCRLSLQWFINIRHLALCTCIPPPPWPSPPSSTTSSPRSSWLGACLSDFGASI